MRNCQFYSEVRFLLDVEKIQGLILFSSRWNAQFFLSQFSHLNFYDFYIRPQFSDFLIHPPRSSAMRSSQEYHCISNSRYAYAANLRTLT